MVITGDPQSVASAYVSARSEIETLLVKDGKANRSTYPTLAGILAAITPTLIKHGLVLMQETTSNEFGVGVSTTLLHSSGSSIDFAPLTMMPADLKPQTVGSTISYCRRYALVSALGLVGGKEDDDGERGTHGEKPQPQPKATANGYHDDELWTPNEKAKRNGGKDLISPTMLKRLEELMLSYYGKNWQSKEAGMVQGASKGSASTFAELLVIEAEVMIEGLVKRIAEAQKQESQLKEAA